MFRANINGTFVWEIENSDPQTFANVKVYASDPWYPVQSGVLRNIMVESRDPQGDFIFKGQIKFHVLISRSAALHIVQMLSVSVISKAVQYVQYWINKDISQKADY